MQISNSVKKDVHESLLIEFERTVEVLSNCYRKPGFEVHAFYLAEVEDALKQLIADMPVTLV